MVRIGLSLYLMFSALAGPWLCCCTTERMAALFASPTTKTSHVGCCGHHAATGSQKQRTPEQRPGNKDQPGRQPCPCQEDGSRQALLASPDSEVAKEFQSRNSFQAPVGFLSLLPTALCLSAEGNPQRSGEGVLLPFLSAQDILYSLHNLRC
jgi:hypothetical protein